MKLFFTIYCVAWLGVFSAHSEEIPPAFEKADVEDVAQYEEEYDIFDPTINAPKAVRVQMEYIDISHKDLTRLMMQEKSFTSNAGALRMKVQDMVDKDLAKVIETQMAVARSGQKATTESIKENIYPTEYEAMGNAVPKEGEKPEVVGSKFNAAFPSSFETRNVGSVFEIEPAITEDDKIIDIRFNATYVWDVGNTIWSESKGEKGIPYKIQTPNFYKVNIDTSVTTISGQYYLVGLVSPKDAKGNADSERKVMMFLKCDVICTIP